MKPPMCELCSSGFDLSDPELGDLLYFKKTASDKAWYKKAEEPGFVGHPPNAAWFCGDHIKKAKELLDFPLGEALQQMRSELSEYVDLGDKEIIEDKIKPLDSIIEEETIEPKGFWAKVKSWFIR